MKILIVISPVIFLFALTSVNTESISLNNLAKNYSGSGNTKTFSQEKKWTWPCSTPEEQNLDRAKLEKLVQKIREGKIFLRLDSLLIVRNAKLVVEEYFRGYNATRTHTLQSVTKSFTSALVGIALDKGHFKSLNEKIIDFFPKMKGIKNLDRRKKAIRIKDLLTMRSGTDYNEYGSDSPHFQLNALSRGWDRFYLNRPMLNQPGTHFLYDSGGVILLSSLLKHRTGMHADRYMERYLFKPLHVSNFHWFKNQEGHPHTGGGLDLKPRDMAKFGQLYLQKGVWLGRRVVPATWVDDSVKMHVQFSQDSKRVMGYGYLWWIQKPDPEGIGKEYIYAAMGFRGQYIFVIPEYNMVVVVTGDTRSYSDQIKPIKFLYSHILPSVKGKKKD